MAVAPTPVVVHTTDCCQVDRSHSRSSAIGEGGAGDATVPAFAGTSFPRTLKQFEVVTEPEVPTARTELASLLATMLRYPSADVLNASSNVVGVVRDATFPVFAPAVVGKKRTRMVQLAPAASVVAQLPTTVVIRVNPVPVTAIATFIGIVPVPVLLTVMSSSVH